MFDRLMLCLFAALLSGTLLREAPPRHFDEGIRTQARCAVGDCEGREASLRTLVSEVQSAVVTKSEWLNRLGMLTQRQRSAAVTLRMIDSSGARPHAATILLNVATLRPSTHLMASFVRQAPSCADARVSPDSVGRV